MAKEAAGIDGGIAPMRRWNFFMEQSWLDRLERDKRAHGFTSTASFIRFIIIQFFKSIDDSKEKQTKKAK
jgi:hypothetical protein